MSSTGTTTSRSSSLRCPASTSAISRAGPGDPAADLGERPLRGREADPLEGLLDDPLEPLERDGEVRAALRPGDRVHLVEDHRLDGLQQLAAARGEQQVQRLGRRDQDVGRRAEHPLAVALRRVARPHADRERRADPGERAAEVALDVVVERLERRDVEQPEAFARRRRSAGRCRGGTRRASSPSRSAPGRGRARPPRSPARRAPARASGRRTRARTRPSCPVRAWRADPPCERSPRRLAASVRPTVRRAPAPRAVVCSGG